MRIRLAIFALIGLSLAPFLVSQILVAEKNMHMALATAQQSVELSLARTEDLFAGAKVELENLSATVALIDSLRFSSPEQCNRTLTKIVESHQRVKAIALLSPQGTAYCGSETKGIGLSFSERAYFIDSLHFDRIVWSDLGISKVNNKITVVSARAVRIGGEVAFVVLVTLDVASMKQQTFQQFQLQVAQAVLMNGEGEILDKAVFVKGTTPFDDQTLGQARKMGTGIITSDTHDQSSSLVAVVKLPMAAGRLVFAVPIGQIYAAARREMVAAVALVCLETLLIALFVLTALELLILRSLRRMTDVAGRITAGDQSQRVAVRSPFPEFRILSSALNMMVEKLEKASFTDPLTGLANRRALEARLDRCDERLQSVGVACCIAMIDIDHFKLFNDRFGHGTGDSVLQMVGETLRRFAQSGDEMAARYGGEEFTLILSDTNVESVAGRLDALRRSVERLNILHPDSRHGRLTVSIGFALAQSGGNTQETLTRADLALYAAKERGRNRVESDVGPVPLASQDSLFEDVRS
jgi:diguanylate cyclase (GGDEF)-like protein